MAPRRWALLCGGDFYIDGSARDKSSSSITTGNFNSVEGKIRSFPHLKGCVRDVNTIYQFLVDRCGVDPANITKLTAEPATNPDTNNASREPVENEDCWPTYRNIKRELNRIRDTAAGGDLVYIHYSGHGIRRQPPSPDADGDDDNSGGGDSTRGMALVMTDVLRGGPYLTGYQLGAFIKDMVEQKGLRVTLVLDSCYSGRAIRKSPISSVCSRTVPGRYDDSILESDLKADAQADAIMGVVTTPAAQRNTTSIRKSWLSSPTCCTLIMACGPHETALEGCFGSSEFIQGALSYHILETLKGCKNNQFPSHIRLLRRVRKRLKSVSFGQSPGLLGDGSYEFFGATSYIERPACRVTALRQGKGAKGGEIDLDVGEVQGVAVGAYYNIFADTDDGHNDGTQHARLVQVTRTAPFRSTAVPVQGGSVEEIDDGRDWAGVLQRWALPKRVGVRLVNTDHLLATKLQAELEKYPGLELINDDDASVTFTVTISQRGIYNTFQAGLPLPLQHLPRISVTSSDSGIDKLAYVLSHISRFQALRNLLVDKTKSPSSSWRPQTEADKFTFEVTSSGTTSLNTATDAPLRVEEGCKLDISLTYSGSLPTVYGSLFCFDSMWGITKLDPSVEAGRVWEPGEPGYPFLEVTLEVGIPHNTNGDKLDVTSATDVIVALVSTVDHVSWDEICLPPLPADGEDVGKIMVVGNGHQAGGSDSVSRGRSVLLPHHADSQSGTHTRPAKLVKRELQSGPGWIALSRVVQTFPAGRVNPMAHTNKDHLSS